MNEPLSDLRISEWKSLFARRYRRGCSECSTNICWSCSRRFCRRVLSGVAVRYALNQWEALTRLLDDGESGD